MSKVSYWDQIEEAFAKIDIYETYEVFKQGAAQYPAWKIDLLAVHWTMSEIQNGGLEQYFGNPTAILAPEAVLGFQRIGKPEVASALQKAMDMLGQPYPREREDREDRLANLTGDKSGSDIGFSIIPKWVANSTSLESEPRVFDDLDNTFFEAADLVWKTLDEYAAKNVASST